MGIRPHFIPLEHKSDEGPNSIYFYKEVASFDENKWYNYLSKESPDDLLEKATSNLIRESHIIARKIGSKVKFTTLGFNFYLASVVVMAIMAIMMIVLAALTA